MNTVIKLFVEDLKDNNSSVDYVGHFKSQAGVIGRFVGGFFGVIPSGLPSSGPKLNSDVELMEFTDGALPLPSAFFYKVKTLDRKVISSTDLEVDVDYESSVTTALSTETIFPNQQQLHLYGQGTTTEGVSRFLMDYIDNETFIRISDTCLVGAPAKSANVRIFFGVSVPV